ncbi:hypothetical protein [Szabonella alba]|uniref:Uncharacterized protein n=1 Tax=Szabonella alba TaxID=2804194 RepID=A0A8K0VDR7_9RHOB|nr:hypothetical protein [Szabonella alba]MBL4917442.1 hypothetical protein [Szabonella alba]
MPTFLSDDAYSRLLDDLAGAFIAAASAPGVVLRDKLAEVLAGADVLPEGCRGDFEGEGVTGAGFSTGDFAKTAVF